PPPEQPDDGDADAAADSSAAGRDPQSSRADLLHDDRRAQYLQRRDERKRRRSRRRRRCPRSRIASEAGAGRRSGGDVDYAELRSMRELPEWPRRHLRDARAAEYPVSGYGGQDTGGDGDRSERLLRDSRDVGGIRRSRLDQRAGGRIVAARV